MIRLAIQCNTESRTIAPQPQTMNDISAYLIYFTVAILLMGAMGVH